MFILYVLIRLIHLQWSNPKKNKKVSVSINISTVLEKGENRHKRVAVEKEF